MKLVTNSQRLLNSLFEELYAENASEYSKAQYFELFSAEQILKDSDLSDEEIEAGVLGSGNDGGCDAIYVFLNGMHMTEDSLDEVNPQKDSTIELKIIQAKRETSFSEDAIMKWKTTSENLLQIDIDDSIYSSRYNEDVRAAFSVFRNLYTKLLRYVPKLHVEYYYVSFAEELHPNVEAQADELKKQIKRLYPGQNTTVSVNFVRAEELLLLTQSHQENQLHLKFVETPINTGVRQDYVALVNLAEYFRFITDANGELRKYMFESNVRDYQGRNSVNSDIRDTLIAEATEDFWWLNNGITLLADDATLATNKGLVLTNPTVVNGLQTSNEVFRYFKENPQKIESEARNILVRVIRPESEEIRDRIILATNNQTSIPKASLRVNDPIHWQIELYFKGKGLYYDRRKNYYKNQGIKGSQIVSVSFLAQCMISLLLQMPDFARARPSTLLTKDDTYEKLYVENQDLDVFYNAACLGRAIDSTLKRASNITIAQKNDIQFFVLYYAVAKKTQKVVLAVNDIKNIAMEDYTEEYILQIAEEVLAEYNALGGNGQVAKSGRFTERLKELLSS